MKDGMGGILSTHERNQKRIHYINRITSGTGTTCGRLEDTNRSETKRYTVRNVVLDSSGSGCHPMAGLYENGSKPGSKANQGIRGQAEYRRTMMDPTAR
jgi:hypothetical protein